MCNFSSETITNLAQALLKAQEQIKPIQKDATNPFLRNRYASLTAVLDAVRVPLLSNGILVVQRVEQSEPGTVAVETRLIHNSGEWLAGTTVIPLPEAEPGAKVNMGQAVGAAISYARRYGLMSLLSLAAVDEDSDNEIRQLQTKSQPQQQRRTEPQQQQRQVHPAPATSGKEKTEYPGLPSFPGVQYEESKDGEGRNIVLARGATLTNKEALKRVGFRWSPERKAWWVAA